VCYNQKGDKEIGSFDEPGRIVKFEGRFHHEVKFNKFEGERYTIVCFQSYHEDKTEPDPLFMEKPLFVK
jgi:hypothetical protein